MDGDDISHPNRFEKQQNFLQQHPEVNVVGTFMQRFDGNEYADIVTDTYNVVVYQKKR